MQPTPSCSTQKVHHFICRDHHRPVHRSRNNNGAKRLTDNLAENNLEEKGGGEELAHGLAMAAGRGWLLVWRGGTGGGRGRSGMGAGDGEVTGSGQRRRVPWGGGDLPELGLHGHGHGGYCGVREREIRGEGREERGRAGRRPAGAGAPSGGSPEPGGVATGRGRWGRAQTTGAQHRHRER